MHCTEKGKYWKAKEPEYKMGVPCLCKCVGPFVFSLDIKSWAQNYNPPLKLRKTF